MLPAFGAVIRRPVDQYHTRRTTLTFASNFALRYLQLDHIIFFYVCSTSDYIVFLYDTGLMFHHGALWQI